MDGATQGYKQVVKIEDPASPGTYVDVTNNCTNAAAAFSRDNLETSTFGQGDKTNLSGMRDGTFSIDYMMDQALRDLLWKVFLSDAPVSVQYFPEGEDTGRELMTADFNMTNFGDGGNIGAAVGGPAQFHRTGATTRTTAP